MELCVERMGAGAEGRRVTNDRLKIGVVGLGWVGTHRHIPILKSSDDFEVVGVADRNPDRVAAFSETNAGLKTSSASRLADLSWIGEVDAVSIATAPFAHHDLVCEALERGLSVITEKPFAMSFGEGQAMAAAAAKSSGTLAVVHNFQFARSMAKLERDLKSGRLGEIRAVRAVQFGNPERRLPTWIDQLPLGLFYDESPHLLYLLARIAGPIDLAKAVIVESRDGAATPSQVDAWFRSPAGYPVSLSCSFEATVSEWYLIVHGDQGVGIVDIFRDIYVRLPNDGRHSTTQVVRTSALATWQHWAQHFSSGALHVTGRLKYGNDKVLARFAAGVRGDAETLRPIDATSALGTLALQHQVIEHAERLSL